MRPLARPAPPMFAIGSPRWPGLSKLSEEAGEVIQVIGKLMGTGGEVQHWDGSNLAERLIEEVGDVLAACDFVVEKNLPLASVAERRAKKLALFRKWHDEAITTAPTAPPALSNLGQVQAALAAAVVVQREHQREDYERVCSLRATLIALGCSHPAEHITEHRWEHDNGYGQQHRVAGEYCLLCHAVRYWKGSGEWVSKAARDEYDASQT